MNYYITEYKLGEGTYAGETIESITWRMAEKYCKKYLPHLVVIGHLHSVGYNFLEDGSPDLTKAENYWYPNEN